MEKLLNNLAQHLREQYPQYMFEVLIMNNRIVIYNSNGIGADILYQVVVDSNPFERNEYCFIVKDRSGAELERTRDFVMIKGETYF